jgi:methyl-accepting chemotaxis protein
VINGNIKTLRRQFLLKILSILVIITIVSGVIQLYFMNEQISSQVSNEAEILANNIVSNLEETSTAAEIIEQQIDTELVSYSKRIAELLKEKQPNQVTNEYLKVIKEEVGVAGITIFKENDLKDDIVGVYATEEEEIGFGLKEVGLFEMGKQLLTNKNPNLSGATFTNTNTVILPISQSASHKNEAVYFKYAYYHVPNSDYIINPYMEANEVSLYMKKVGPQERVDQIRKMNKVVEEVAVLNPKVFQDPTLENDFFPPMKKVEAGDFTLQTSKDLDFLKKDPNRKFTHIEKIDGRKYYKMFLPINESQVVYLSLDYGSISKPLYSHSIILIVTGAISLLVLFLFGAGFFNRIYENIQRIRSQVHLLEAGNLTANSKVNDGGELQKLSESANRMVVTLRQTIKDTSEQAMNIQRLSLLLEADAAQSIEKIYSISSEATINTREQLFEIIDFLDKVNNYLQHQKNDPLAVELVEKIETMKELAKERTAATTDITISLFDVLQSLHLQSSEMSMIANTLLQYMNKFKL